MSSDTTLTREQWDTINKALREPFDPSLISFRVQSNGKDSGNNNGKSKVLAYIDARDVQDRLDEVVGAGNWSFDWEPVSLDAQGNVAVAKGKLTIYGVTRADVGTKSTFEASKGAVSIALKRVAAQFGIARYLYDLPDIYARVQGQRIDATTLKELRAKMPKPGDIKGRAQFDDAGDESTQDTTPRATTATTATTAPTTSAPPTRRQSAPPQPRTQPEPEAPFDPSLDPRLDTILKRTPDLRKTYATAKQYGLTGNEFFRVFLNVTGWSKKELLEKAPSMAHKQAMADYVAKMADEAKVIAARTPDLADVATRGIGA